MSVIRYVLLIFLLSYIRTCIFAQLETNVIDTKAKTVQVHLEIDPLSYPFLLLGSHNKIQVSFDYLDAGIKEFSYTLVHCNYDWKPSRLQYFEYAEGFEENEVTEYFSSLNTTVEYTHYSFLLPNDDVRITRSGNYIVKVFHTGKPDSVVFQYRFVVYESLVGISPQAKRATLIEKSDDYQEVDFSLDIDKIDVDNPYSDIKVSLLQNGIWKTARHGIAPLYVKQSIIEYDGCDEGLMKGNNEFRRLNFKSFTFKFENTLDVEFDDTYSVVLRPDEDKRFKVYLHNEDFNGKYYVFVERFEDVHVMADYAYVHFKLSQDQIIASGNIYVWGALTNWELKPENELIYNSESNSFEGKLLLKQGYYDYYYAYLPQGETIPDIEYFEGSHYETENDYIIIVYTFDKFLQCDRVVGLEIINTQKK